MSETLCPCCGLHMVDGQQDVQGLIAAIEDALQEIEYDYTNAKMVAADLRKALKSYQEGRG